jgi:hypothetical protein
MSPNLVAQPHQPQLSGTSSETKLSRAYGHAANGQVQARARHLKSCIRRRRHHQEFISSLIIHHPTSTRKIPAAIHLRRALRRSSFVLHYNIIAIETVTARDISTYPFALAVAVAVSACGDAGANPSFLRLHRIVTHCISFAYTITTTLDDGNPNVHNASAFGSLLRLLPSQCAFHPLSKRISALLFPSNIPTAQCAIDPLRNMPRTPIYAQLS